MYMDKDIQRSPVLQKGHGQTPVIVHKRWPVSFIVVTLFILTLAIVSTTVFTVWLGENKMQIALLTQKIDLLETQFDQLLARTDMSQYEDDDDMSVESPSDQATVSSEDIPHNLGVLQRMRRDTEVESTTQRKPRRSSKNKKRRQKNSPNKRSSSIDAMHFEARVPAYNKSALVTYDDKVEIVGKDGFISKAGFHSNGKTYKFWDPVPFGDQTSVDFLHVSRDNHFTVERSGLYFIYAQVLYHDLSGRWAFGIYVNDNIRAQCTTSQHVTNDYIQGLPDSHKASHGVYMHCYTGVVVHAERRQRVSIRSLYHGRTVVALGRSTFWGMVKLKDLEKTH